MGRKLPKHVDLNKIYYTSKGLPYKVEEYHGYDDVRVRFLNTNNTLSVYSSTLKTGNIKDHLHPEVFGKGFIGEGDYKCSVNGKITKAYKCWNGMLERCYSSQLLLKRPTYVGCSVVDSWLNFQEFAKWFFDNYTEGYELDKDILVWVSGMNKVYSPTTCIFIPPSLNKFLTASDATRSGEFVGTHRRIEKSGEFKGRYIAKVSCEGESNYLGIFDDEYSAHKEYCKYKEGILVRWVRDKVYNKQITQALSELLEVGMENFYNSKNGEHNEKY